MDRGDLILLIIANTIIWMFLATLSTDIFGVFGLLFCTTFYLSVNLIALIALMIIRK